MWRSWCVAAVVLGAVGAAPAVASTPRPARPDLRVTSGSLHEGHNKLLGSLTVSNTGTASATASTTALAVVIGHEVRVLKHFAVPALAAGRHHTSIVAVSIPSGIPAGKHSVEVCADSGHTVRESSETNNCRTVGSITIAGLPIVIPTPAVPVSAPSPSSTPSASTTPTPTPTTPVSTVPTDPIAYQADTPFEVSNSHSDYWLDVPSSYDSTNQTPTKLLVWLHGCGGYSEGDIDTVSPGVSGNAQDWISVAVGGEEGQCWNVDNDGALVFAAIADVESHVNISRRQVILGGYSSGGDLAYRTCFYNALDFAGLIIENSSPFRDTDSSEQASLAAAAWKFNVTHLAHKQDMTYPIAGVEDETNAMINAGFPMDRIEVDGGHYDNPGDTENGHSVPGTDADLVAYLLPSVDAGWEAPAS